MRSRLFRHIASFSGESLGEILFGGAQLRCDPPACVYFNALGGTYKGLGDRALYQSGQHSLVEKRRQREWKAGHPCDGGGSAQGLPRQLLRSFHLSARSNAAPSRASLRGKAVTGLIKYCKSPRALQKLLHARGPHLDFIHCGAALTVAATLYRQIPPSQRQGAALRDYATLMPELEQLVDTCLGAMDARGLANALHAFAVLEHVPQPELVQKLKARLDAELGNCLPQHVASVLWSLAKLELQPKPDFLERLMGRALAVLPDMNPHSVSNAVWALGKLRTFEMPLQHEGAQQTQPSGSHPQPRIGKPADGFLELQSPADSGEQLQKQFLVASCEAVAAHARAFSGQGLANFMLGLAQLGYPPGQKLTEELVRQCTTQGLGHFNNQELSNLSWAFARFGVNPGRLYFEAVFAELPSRLAELNCHDVSNLLWSAAVFRRPPPAELLAGIVSALEGQLPAANSADISTVAWALARLRCRPGESFLSALEAEVDAKLGTFEAGRTLTCLWSFVMMDWHPSDALLDAAYHMAARGETFSGDWLSAHDNELLISIVAEYARRAV